MLTFAVYICKKHFKVLPFPKITTVLELVYIFPVCVCRLAFMCSLSVLTNLKYAVSLYAVCLLIFFLPNIVSELFFAFETSSLSILIAF